MEATWRARADRWQRDHGGRQRCDGRGRWSHQPARHGRNGHPARRRGGVGARSAAAATRRPAALTIVSTTPDPLPAGLGLSHQPSSTGTTERLQLRGAGSATVTVDGATVAVGANGTFDVDVAPNTTRRINIELPGQPEATETLGIFFDKSEPAADGWAAEPRPLYHRYVDGSPSNPDDVEFNKVGAPGGFSQLRGRDAVRDWVNRRLVAVNGQKSVSLTAHASFETDSSFPSDVARQQSNQELSERRLDVAVGIIGGLATVTDRVATGQARAESGSDTPWIDKTGQRLNDPRDRVVDVKGVVKAALPVAPSSPSSTVTPTRRRSHPNHRTSRPKRRSHPTSHRSNPSHRSNRNHRTRRPNRRSRPSRPRPRSP